MSTKKTPDRNRHTRKSPSQEVIGKMWQAGVVITEASYRSHPATISSSDFESVMHESSAYFASLLGRCWFSCRTHSGNPREDLKKALLVAESCVKHWSRLRGGSWTQLNFPIGTAILLSRFLDSDVPGSLLAVLPDCENWTSNRLYARGYLDVGLVWLLRDRKMPNGYDALLCEFEDKFGCQLLANTYRTYVKCIRACLASDLSAADAALQECQQLYLARADDREYRDFDTAEGASNANPYSIDYGIAAIVFQFPKCFTASTIEGCPHIWLWD